MELFVNIERVSISTRGAASCPKCHKLSSECTQPMKLKEKRPSPVRYVIVGWVKAGWVGGCQHCLSIICEFIETIERRWLKINNITLAENNKRFIDSAVF